MDSGLLKVLSPVSLNRHLGTKALHICILNVYLYKHAPNLVCVYFVWLSNVSSCKLYYVFCSQALCISIHILYVTCISVPILAVYVFGNFSNSNSILSCVQRNQKQSVVAINRFRAIPMLHAYQ